MIPVSYSETLNSKIMKKGPREYISDIISPKLGLFYAVSIVALIVFGFGGFQFSGIDSVFTIVASKFMNVELTLMQRYLFIVIPVIAIVAFIVLSKKDDVFMNAMTYMIGSALAGYLLFATIFIGKTSSYIPILIRNDRRYDEPSSNVNWYTSRVYIRYAKSITNS